MSESRLDAIRDRVIRGRFGACAQDAADISSIMFVTSTGRREIRQVLLGVGEAQLILHAPGDLAWLLAEVERLKGERDTALKWAERAEVALLECPWALAEQHDA